MLKGHKTSLPTRSQILQSINMSKSKQNLNQYNISSLSMASSPKEQNRKNNNVPNFKKQSNSLKKKNQLSQNSQQVLKLNIGEEHDKENIQKHANYNFNKTLQQKSEIINNDLKLQIQEDRKSYSTNQQKKQDNNAKQLSLSASKNKVAYSSISLIPVILQKQNTNRGQIIYQNQNSKQGYIILQEEQFQPKQLSIDERNIYHQNEKINQINQKCSTSESKRQNKTKQAIPNNMISFKQFTENFQEKIKEQKMKKQALKETTQRLITQTSKENLRSSHNRKQESLNKGNKNTQKSSNLNKTQNNSQKYKTKTIEDQKNTHQTEKFNKTTNSISQMSKVSQMCSPKSYIRINDFTNSLPQSLNSSIEKSKSKKQLNANSNNSIHNNKKGKKQLVINIEQTQQNDRNKKQSSELSECTCHQFFNNWGFLLYQASLQFEQHNSSFQKIIQKMFQNLNQKTTPHQKNHLSLFIYQLKQLMNKILQKANKNSKEIYTNILDRQLISQGQTENISNETMKISLHKKQENERQESHKKIKIHLKTKSSSRKQIQDFIISDSLMQKNQIVKKMEQQKSKNQNNSKKRLRVSNKKSNNQQVNQIQSIIKSSSKNNSLINNSSSQMDKFYQISPYAEKKNNQQKENQRRQNSFFLKNSKTQAICGISSIGHSFGNSIDISMFEDPLHMLQIPYNQQLFQDNSLVYNQNKNEYKKWINNASAQLPKSTLVIKKNK